ncbi:hypothetical protein [Mycolicibacter minnesotensis]
MQEMVTTDVNELVALAIDAQDRVDAAEAARRVALHRRRSPIIALHQAGWGERRIAHELGISHTAVWKILGRADTR